MIPRAHAPRYKHSNDRLRASHARDVPLTTSLPRTRESSDVGVSSAMSPIIVSTTPGLCVRRDDEHEIRPRRRSTTHRARTEAKRTHTHVRHSRERGNPVTLGFPALCPHITVSTALGPCVRRRRRAPSSPAAAINNPSCTHGKPSVHTLMFVIPANAGIPDIGDDTVSLKPAVGRLDSSRRIRSRAP